MGSGIACSLVRIIGAIAVQSANSPVSGHAPRLHQADLPRRVSPRSAMALSRGQHMQYHMTRFRRRQPAHRGDLYQRQRCFRRRGRILLAHRDGDRRKVILVGYDLHTYQGTEPSLPFPWSRSSSISVPNEE